MKYTFHCFHCNRDFKSTSEYPIRCTLCRAINFHQPIGTKKNCPTKTNSLKKCTRGQYG